MKNPAAQIVITGIGMISRAGAGAPEALAAVREKRPLPPGSAASIDDSLVDKLLDSRQARRMARASRFAMVAAKEALRDAGLATSNNAPQDNAGVVCATTHLSTQYGEEFHHGFLQPGKPVPSPTYFSNGCLNAAGSHLSMEFRFTGCNHTVVGGLNAGLHAAVVGARLLAEGPLDTVLCCACEELAEILIGAYAKFRLSPPMSPAEGGAALVLETAERARRRGARPYARLAAWHNGHGPDLRRDPEGKGIAGAIRAAAGDGVELYSACANGTDLDAVEESARRAVLPGSTSVIEPKIILGEGFSFGSLSQAVIALAEMRQSAVASSAACSFDRRGDVTSVAFRKAE